MKKNAECSSKKNEDPNPTGLTIKLVTDLQFGMAQSSYFKICIVSSNGKVYYLIAELKLITKFEVSFKEKISVH